MKKSVMIAVAVGTVAFIGTQAWAGEGKPQGNEGRHRGERKHSLAQMDTNGDGKISLEEFKAGVQARIEERFKALDTNGDGVLTKEDRPQGEGRRHGRPDGQGNPENSGRATL